MFKKRNCVSCAFMIKVFRTDSGHEHRSSLSVDEVNSCRAGKYPWDDNSPYALNCHREHWAEGAPGGHVIKNTPRLLLSRRCNEFIKRDTKTPGGRLLPSYVQALEEKKRVQHLAISMIGTIAAIASAVFAALVYFSSCSGSAAPP